MGKGWFDGYTGQRVALFDDYTGDLDLDLFLRITDRYKCNVPVKGSSVYWNPEVIYFTSNINPTLWYMFRTYEQSRAMERRLTKVYEINESFF